MIEERLLKRIERLKKARQQAELILEQKSLELFENNQTLKKLHDSLEQQVKDRTKELKHTRDKALAAAKAKAQFMANMSHEIRTPLNGVIGLLRMIADSPLSSQQKALLETAQSSGVHLLGIVNDILDFSKIEAGEMQLYEEPINLKQEIKSLLKTFSIVTGEKNITLSHNFDSNFPKYIKADSLRIRQIITNVISNSIKFTESGEIKVEVTLEPNKQYQIKITDTGIGMTEDQLSKVFGAFSQADSSTTRNYGGTGLGLTITDNLVKLMNGKISIESQYGKGTSFTIQLPLNESEALNEVDYSEITENTRFKETTILLVFS